MKLANKVSSKIDWYGQGVGINFKGQSAITTKLGALLTIVSIAMASAYGYGKLYQLINRSGAQIN